MDGNLQKYAAFVAAVEQGSFTKAAEALRYAQSSVSKMIADLEREWDVTLLERDRSGVRLTPEGRALLPHARALCEDYRLLREEMQELNGIQKGALRIGAYNSIATHWLPNIIRAFQKDYPNIEYEILLGHYSAIEQWVTEGRVDCGFLRLPAGAEFTQIALERDELVVVSPLDHPFAAQDSVRMEQLEDAAFLLLEQGGKTEISELLEKYQVKPKIRFTTWDDYAIMSMVERGFGVAILPRLILHRAPYRLAIRSLSTPEFRQIGLITRRREIQPAALKKFLQYLDYRRA